MTAIEMPVERRSALRHDGAFATQAPAARPFDLSVVIVGYRSLKLIVECLATWDAAVAGINAELIVVENGTGEPAADVLRAQRPEARVIELDKSIGFGAAVNRGLSEARGRHVALLNPDTALEPRSLTRLVQRLDRDPRIGIVGPRVWDDVAHSSIQRSWRRFPGVSTALFGRYSLLTRLWPSNPWTRRYLNQDRSPDECQETDWVSGCCMVVRGTLFRALGGMDERFPLFCEDVDLCRSAWDAGFTVVYDPSSAIVHEIGGSRKTARMRSTWLRHRSMTAWVLKYRRAVSPLTWLLVAGIWARFVLQAIRGRV